MIIVRAPLRISFFGGGSDIRDFYRRSRGRVIAAAINQYIHIAVDFMPFTQKILARYSVIENVDNPSNIQNSRIREALLDLKITKGVEITSFSSLPSGIGLGSSSTFSVALLRALFCYLNQDVSIQKIAEAACRLEVDLLKEPIGKEDQYVAAYGGLNVFQFNADESVLIEPVEIDDKQKENFGNHILLFFTGLTRPASRVLVEQKANVDKNFDILKSMADSVDEFKNNLISNDFQGLGEMLHQGWLKKKRLASNVSNAIIDELYDTGIQSGAWGGKVLGAGSGGCLLFLSPIEKKAAICKAIQEIALKHNLNNSGEIPVNFASKGVEVIWRDDNCD